MLIEELKDPRDRAFCERAQHSHNNNVISVWDIPGKRFSLAGALFHGGKLANLKQIESKTHPAKEAYDNATDNEFHSRKKSSTARTIQNFMEEVRNQKFTSEPGGEDE